MKEEVKDGLVAVASFAVLILATLSSQLPAYIGINSDERLLTVIGTFAFYALPLLLLQLDIRAIRYALAPLFVLHMLLAFSLVSMAASLARDGTLFVILSGLLALATHVQWFRTAFSRKV